MAGVSFLRRGLGVNKHEIAAEVNARMAADGQRSSRLDLGPNAEAIAAVPGVDVLFIGPGDLSLRLGCMSGVNDPRMLEAQKRVAAAARQHGKAWGDPRALPRTSGASSNSAPNSCRWAVSSGRYFSTFRNVPRSSMPCSASRTACRPPLPRQPKEPRNAIRISSGKRPATCPSTLGRDSRKAGDHLPDELLSSRLSR